MSCVLLKIFKGHQGAITTMSTDANGRILYTASADATIRSWNISQGQVLKVKFGRFSNTQYKQNNLTLQAICLSMQFIEYQNNIDGLSIFTYDILPDPPQS